MSDERVRSDEERLMAWLETHDEVCPACRYDLRGLSSPVCPECSSRLCLSVASPDMRLGAWIFALVSFALGLGFDAVVLVIMTVGAVIGLIGLLLGGGGGGPPASFYVLPVSLVVLAVVCLTGIGLLIRRRSRWVRLTPRGQWRAAGLIFLSVGSVHLLAGIAFIIIMQ